MGYQKTAKDLAWDRERAKLKSEIAQWQDKFAKAQSIISAQEQEMLAYEMENQELRDAIADLTDGKMTPDEVLEHMRKGSQLADMLNFFKSNPLLDRYL